MPGEILPSWLVVVALQEAFVVEGTPATPLDIGLFESALGNSLSLIHI